MSNLGDKVTRIYTDSLPSYYGLPLHDSVNHSIYEWSRGEVHTNTVERMWSLVKQTMRATYNYVSPGYLSLYIKELEWKYNHRHVAVWQVTLKEILKYGNYVPVQGP